MPIFKFKASATVSCWTQVEAGTLEEARQKANNRTLAGLVYNPFSRKVTESWLFENDGEPQNIELDDG